VVAGVIGMKKFIYDLWGDTVNIAARVTEQAGPSTILVDATTYRRVRNEYDFEGPQTIHVKGKGEITVYRLLAPKAQSAGVAITGG
jgi:class 3 adenylate cyclase